MCRMLGIVTLNPLSTYYLQDFRRLAETGRVSRSAETTGHKDGWGVVHIDKHPVYLDHKALENHGSCEANAATSPSYSRLCVDIGQTGLKGVFLAHLRRASRGAKTLENTAPFIDGGWSFTHNGTVYKMGSPNLSDSRVFFKMLLEALDEQSDALDGIGKVVSKIRADYTYSSLTFLLADTRRIYACRECTQDEEYYSLKYAYTEDSTLVISQEETWPLNWTSIPNHRVVIVDRNLKIEGPFRI